MEFSRLVLYGVLFGVPVEAIVAAVFSSLHQDVFTLPNRLFKSRRSDDLYRENLRHSMNCCTAFDNGQFSEMLMVCSMFKK